MATKPSRVVWIVLAKLSREKIVLAALPPSSANRSGENRLCAPESSLCVKRERGTAQSGNAPEILSEVSEDDS